MHNYHLVRLCFFVFQENILIHCSCFVGWCSRTASEICRFESFLFIFTQGGIKIIWYSSLVIHHSNGFVIYLGLATYPPFQDIVTICKRRGGSDTRNLSHHEWLQTVQSEPDVISMTFIPITSLLNGVPGSGFLSHAINLYLRCKL